MNPETPHQMIEQVIHKRYIPFQNLDIPIYDQLISLIINNKITVDILEEFKNEYLKNHCYDNCKYIQHIIFIEWDHTPKIISRCNQCNILIQMDYVVDIYKKQRYPSIKIHDKSRKNLLQLQLCYS